MNRLTLPLTDSYKLERGTTFAKTLRWPLNVADPCAWARSSKPIPAMILQTTCKRTISATYWQESSIFRFRTYLNVFPRKTELRDGEHCTLDWWSGRQACQQASNPLAQLQKPATLSHLYGCFNLRMVLPQTSYGPKAANDRLQWLRSSTWLLLKYY